ncbi:MAG: NUDIX hydrolase [Sarcina sp.]
MNKDCGFTRENKWFRYRAAAIIIEDGCILFAKNDRNRYYYSIGGAVELGEKAEDAVRRETYEETGVNYEIDRLAFIHENFFRDDNVSEKCDCHEVTLYFFMKSRGTKELNSNSYSNGVREYMHWIPINDLKNYEAYPTFFSEKLLNIQNYVEHIVTKEIAY